ncbi:MAG: CRISPR system precrRNA processing endoribonuclease RAMP protein Cas6, partial [Chloroflexi bacterium]|nr:CRISPR system precrRNA processing endoribonuclease RAMP protein Cas6 [Chloroflexota bacterium]
RQFAGQPRRSREDVIRLTNIANQVKLVDANVKWHEIWSRSGRKSSKTPLSGFTGTAVYYSDSWESLMPWLVLGQATQLGKSTAKGNGVYELAGGGWPLYWDWLRLSYDELFA